MYIPDDINILLAHLLPVHAATLLKRVAMQAGGSGWACYLVGGYVRDALLQRPDYDVDVAVEGDAVEVATGLAEESGFGLEIHGRFGTATLELPEGLHIDIVTARKESYPQPGALPVVEAGTIQDDLARRDFTINALAVPVLPGQFGSLLDPHGGVRDLRAKLIRVLHPNSFRDDPTRIFRAVKLSHRLGFKIEQGTLELVLQAVRDGALGTVSVERAVRELWLILEEEQADAMLATLEHLGVLAAIHPDLSWPYEAGRMRPGEQSKAGPDARRNAYLATIAAEFAPDPAQAEALARWLRLPAPTVRLMHDAARMAQLWPSLSNSKLRPSQVYRMLHDLDPAAIEAYGLIDDLAQDKEAWAHLQSYLQTTRHTKPHVGGNYLRKLGLEPGPIYKEAMDALLDAVLDGPLHSEKEEERFLRGWLREKSLLGGSEGEEEGRRSGARSEAAPE